MTTALHYKANLRDIFFNLFEVLGTDEVLGRGPFSELDGDGAREALRALESLATNELAASFAEIDREPAHLDAEGVVRLPEGLKRAMQTYYENGWHKLELPPHLGGAGAPPSVVWSAFEMVAGSNAAAGFLLFGTFFGRILDRLGTPSQKKRYLPQWVEKPWGGAMVLTEPEAGSDVGAGRTSARHLHDDVWAIEGSKRFITNADYEGPENVVHLVLARPEGAAPGTKGLSLFVVPKYWVDEEGRCGERNGWRVTKLEKKMGIKSSVTCEVSYGAEGECRGLLVGEVHDGIRQMFHVIEQARMAVGMKSMAEASTGYLNALAYAKERVQGPALDRAADKTAPRVRIVEHADVRRMLMHQKSHVEGMRALGLYIASLQDRVELLGGHGHPEARELDKLNDLMLPLLKGYCSEKSWELLTLALQVHGGSGYCQDYPVEQYLRDQKIDSLYEGTTHIQALDLFFRKVARDGGQTLQGLLGRARDSIARAEGGEALTEERAALAAAIDDLEGIFAAMMAKVGESVHHVGFQGNRILFAVTEVVIGWLLLRHAAVALAAREGATGDDRAYYDGKVASCRYFAREVLPGVGFARAQVERGTLALMSLAEESF